MGQKKEVTQVSEGNWRVWCASLLVLVSCIAYAQLTQYPSLWRVLGVALAVALALFVLYPSPLVKKVMDLFRGARVELRKVVWPARVEAYQMTGLVALVVVIVAFLLWLIDSGLMSIVSQFTG